METSTLEASESEMQALIEPWHYLWKTCQLARTKSKFPPRLPSIGKYE